MTAPSSSTERLISKRLHISGVIPATTPADLKTRLEAVGTTAKFIEGFDKLDRVGRPRGFGHVDIVGSEDGLRKLERQRAPPPPSRPPKHPRGVHRTHAPSMDPVSPAEAKSRKVFRVAETGRMVTLVRVRPGKEGKGRKGDPPTQARRRTIDPV
ncbi:hypothetical protein GLOTRDRAFT_128712 [Gloeophyllum trabeum ATCC 11539]|uniref:RRM domain-containing protein n=1 Tax=Gloeophyllum trabeum (strain ATCC 11539 / FP-39264 / Madison 617) TaxID=670483 RepID=S7QA39_GLOTA|nr:uncharacterized protein GLOTRDRAFT_128712 [Gloeophyllum trabeum ATCC 11539]EPQ56776.1 hypothetical protein GLOTRDRAFT_128712 [Gloeophyllum trabeum ATCC 11539]